MSTCFSLSRPTRVTLNGQRFPCRRCCCRNRCDDSNGEFFFENGATVHFTFSDRNRGKRLKHEQIEHGNEPLSSYDAVIMNSGNPPRMKSSVALAGAIEVQNAGAQFVWLSEYGRGTGIDSWPEDEREAFYESGAKFLDVNRMVTGLKYLTKGKVEGSGDPHFCMPGPPNEIAILVLQLMWAVHEPAL